MYELCFYILDRHLDHGMDKHRRNVIFFFRHNMPCPYTDVTFHASISSLRHSHQLLEAIFIAQAVAIKPRVSNSYDR